MQHPTVELLLLDLGGVVLEVDPLEVPRRLGIPEQSLHAFCERIGNQQVFLDFEAGTLDRDGFYRGILAVWDRDFGAPPDRQQLFQAWRGTIRGEIPGVGPILARARHTVRVMALSNTDCIHMEDVIRPMPVARLLEHVFTSYELGHRKPDARIYQRTLTAVESMTGIGSERILFIDDREENVLAARRQGMHAEVCHRSAAVLTEILLGYGIDAAVPA